MHSNPIPTLRLQPEHDRTSSPRGDSGAKVPGSLLRLGMEGRDTMGGRSDRANVVLLCDRYPMMVLAMIEGGVWYGES